jgi:pyruvate formate lyase activating enzyme
MTIDPTPLATLLKAREIAADKLFYVYLGNVAISDGSDTYCPQCGNLLIARRGYAVSVKGISDGACGNCGRKADVVL